jgi:ceramide glucosyltransferase
LAACDGGAPLGRALRERPISVSTFAQFAAGYAIVATGLQGASVALAARKCRRPRHGYPAPAGAPAVSVVQPLCGVEAFSEATLEAAFALDYPEYELVLCIARPDDPAAPLARRAIERHPERKARLLFGDDRPSANPKLNNVVKGWKAARHAWIIIADSNVLMPPDYIQRMMASWRRGVGIVCAPPIGSSPESFAAEIECAFLNTYEARWQYAAEACGLGFAQGKSMLWRRDVLEAGGGIERLGDEIAEDAAATKLVRRAHLRPRLAVGPFDQPLGRRVWSEVWGRQARWARLRRATFPLFFAPELLTSGVLAIVAAIFGAAAFDFAPARFALAIALIWYGSEAALALLAGWRLAPATVLAFLLRDATLPWLWLQAWMIDDFEWRGHAMSTADEEAPPAR